MIGALRRALDVAGRFADGRTALAVVVGAGIAVRVAAYAATGGLVPEEVRLVPEAAAIAAPAPLPPPPWPVAAAVAAAARAGAEPEAARLLAVLASCGAFLVGVALAHRLTTGRRRLAAVAFLAVAPASVLDAARLGVRGLLGVAGGAAILAVLPRADGTAPRGVALLGAAVIAGVAAWLFPPTAVPAAAVALYWVVRGWRSAWTGGEGPVVAVLLGAALVAGTVDVSMGDPDHGLPPFTPDAEPYLPSIAGDVARTLDTWAAPWVSLACRGLGAGSAVVALALVAFAVAGAAAPDARAAARVAAATAVGGTWLAALVADGVTVAHPALPGVLAALMAEGIGRVDLPLRDAGRVVRAALAVGIMVPAAVRTADLYRPHVLRSDLAAAMADLAEAYRPGDHVILVPPVVRTFRWRLPGSPLSPRLGPYHVVRAEAEAEDCPGLTPGAPPGRAWLVFTGQAPDVAQRRSRVYGFYAMAAELDRVIRRPGATICLFRTGAP